MRGGRLVINALKKTPNLFLAKTLKSGIKIARPSQ